MCAHISIWVYRTNNEIEVNGSRRLIRKIQQRTVFSNYAMQNIYEISTEINGKNQKH